MFSREIIKYFVLLRLEIGYEQVDMRDSTFISLGYLSRACVLCVPFSLIDARENEIPPLMRQCVFGNNFSLFLSLDLPARYNIYHVERILCYRRRLSRWQIGDGVLLMVLRLDASVRCLLQMGLVVLGQVGFLAKTLAAQAALERLSV
jgi:hypothetical protein